MKPGAIHTDALGSPIAVTNATGAVIERNDYEPYGTIIGKPNYQGFGFTGHLQDSETGLAYMQQRYYDPTVGRFLSVDPVTALSSPVGMFNRYKYAANNPYRFVDPDGRQEKQEQERERRDTRSFGGHPAAGGMSVSGVPATATDRQKDMVAVASSGHASPEAAAVKFGNDTQQKAKEDQREPQSGIVKLADKNYAYTKPMWGPKGEKIVSVAEYTRALVAVYGANALGLAHGHFDGNLMFSPADVGNSEFLTFMHNQAGETRMLNADILRREIRNGSFRNVDHLLQVKQGANGKCIGGCD